MTHFEKFAMADVWQRVKDRVHEYQAKRQAAIAKDERQRMRPSNIAWAGTSMLPLAGKHFLTKGTHDPANASTEAVIHLMHNSGLDLNPVQLPNVGGKEYHFKPAISEAANEKLRAADPAKFEEQGLHGKLVRFRSPYKPEPEEWSVPAVARELGLAQTHYSTNPVTKFLARVREPAAVAGGAGAIIQGLRAATGVKPMAERDKLYNQSSAFGAAATAPGLINEYQISRNALKLLADTPEAAGQLVSARKLLPRSFGAYGLAALAAVGGPQLAKYIAHRTHDR